VRGGVVVELQGAGQRVEDLLRRMLIAPLLEAHVVVDADAGQQRDLLAPQPGHPAATAEIGQRHVLGTRELAARAQVVADQVLARHAINDTPARTPDPGPYKTPEQGAATSVLVATSPQLEGIGGHYFADCNEPPLIDPGVSPAPRGFGVAAYALDPADAERLWERSLELLGPQVALPSGPELALPTGPLHR
jgi:hypothetical protein